MAPPATKTRRRARPNDDDRRSFWQKLSPANRSQLSFAVLVIVLAVAIRFIGAPNDKGETKYPVPSAKKAAPVVKKAVEEPAIVSKWWKRTGKGRERGIVAREFIPVGTMIMLETPMITLKGLENRSSAATELFRQIDGLGPKTKETYFQLPFTPSRSSELQGDGFEDRVGDLALNIFETNSVRTSESSSALFNHVSYIDHSCLPNVELAYRADLGAMLVHALLDIDPGEMIGAAYFDASGVTRADRQEYLKKSHDIDCKCFSCSLTGDALVESDKRRTKVADSRKVVKEWGEKKVDSQVALSTVAEASQTLSAEGYLAGMGEWGSYGLTICASHLDESCTRFWAWIASMNFGKCKGEDSPEAKVIREIMEDPTKAKSWASREKRHLEQQAAW